MAEFKAATDKKVAVFLADGCEEIEALTVVDLLYRAGIPVKSVSITGTKDVISSHNVHIVADATIDEIDFAEYDMLVLPGGLPGTTHLGECAKLTDAVLAHYNAGREVAAICAAPTVLAGLGILEGRKATCFPAQEGAMKGAVLTHASATVDGNVITGRGMGCSIPFALTIIEHYFGREAAEAMAERIVYSGPAW